MRQKRRNLNEKNDGIFGNDVHKIGWVGTVLRRVSLSKFYGSCVYGNAPLVEFFVAEVSIESVTSLSILQFVNIFYKKSAKNSREKFKR